MDFIENSDEYYNLIKPVVNSSGFEIVELVSRNLYDGLHIHLIIHSPDGVTIDNCGKIHRAVQRRIEALSGTRDLYMEVSSPGITRNLKSANEFLIFKGSAVKILKNESSEWNRYRITDADNSGVLLLPAENGETVVAAGDIEENMKNSVRLEYSDIKKAKLDN